MSKLFCCALLLASVSAAGAMGTYPQAAAQWQPFHVSGGAFKAGYGPDGTAVVTRDGYLPDRRSSSDTTPGKLLPEGTGAVAGVCFIETSGGKLGATSGHLPMEGVEVTIRRDKAIQTVTTGRDGFFVATVPPGKYDVEVGGVTRQVTVDRGKTSLVPLRGGKRMRD